MPARACTVAPFVSVTRSGVVVQVPTPGRGTARRSCRARAEEGKPRELEKSPARSARLGTVAASCGGTARDAALLVRKEEERLVAPVPDGVATLAEARDHDRTTNGAAEVVVAKARAYAGWACRPRACRRGC